MKIVKVTYTTKPAFAEKNQVNIKAVMADLRRLQCSGINYNSCVCEDRKTFIHTAFFKSEEDQKMLNDLPSFLHFQEELKSNGFEIPPDLEILTLVDSSCDIFLAD